MIKNFRFSVLLLATLTAQAGEKVGNGGKGVVSKGRLYLLDLVEAGVEKAPQDFWGVPKKYKIIRGIESEQDIEGRWIAARHDENIRDVYVMTSHGKVKRQVFDQDGLPTLEWIQRASNAQNDDLFGHPTYDCQNCYSENSFLAIALVNAWNHTFASFEYPIGQSFYERSSGTIAQFKDAWYRMSWVLVDAPLKISHDENSSIVDPVKYMMASREGAQVRIHKAAWSEGLEIQGKFVKPLDANNQLALIMHELLYYITASQGDTNSDRAREANGKVFTPYTFRNGNAGPSFSSLIQTIPGRPSKNPYYLYELPEGQEVEVIADFGVPQANDRVVLSKDMEPMSYDDYFGHSYPGPIAVFWHLAGDSELTKKGTHFRIAKIEYLEVYRSHSEVYLWLEAPWSTDSVFIQVYVGGSQKKMATLQDFKDATSRYLRLLD